MSSLLFDNVSDYCTLGSDVLNGATAVSIEAWMKRSNNNVGNTRYIFIRIGTNPADQFYLAGTTNKLQIDIDSPVGRWWGDSITALDTNWHHVVLVFDSAIVGPAKCKIYLDGVDDTANAGEVASGSGTLTANTNYISHNVVGGSWDGVIGMVRVWNVALTAAQIANLMRKKRVPENETGLVAQFLFDEGSGLSLIDRSSQRSNATISNAAWNTDTPPVNYPSGVAALTGSLANIFSRAVSASVSNAVSRLATAARKWTAKKAVSASVSNAAGRLATITGNFITKIKNLVSNVIKWDFFTWS